MGRAKMYLQQVKLCDIHIRRLTEDLERTRDMTTQITARLDVTPVSGSHEQDKLGDAVAKIIDLEKDITDAIEEYVSIKNDVIKTLGKVEDANQLNVLYNRYVLGRTWEEIAYEMNYSYYGICKLHGKALQTVEKLLENSKS